jgi:hypothetical protein
LPLEADPIDLVIEVTCVRPGAHLLLMSSAGADRASSVAWCPCSNWMT